MKRDDVLTGFDVPVAVIETGLTGINDREMIAGTYVDANTAYHGFICDTNGTLRTFDVPVTGTRGTGPNNLNNNGQVVGRYSTTHGNIQDPAADMNGLPKRSEWWRPCGRAIAESGRIVATAGDRPLTDGRPDQL